MKIEACFIVDTGPAARLVSIPRCLGTIARLSLYVFTLEGGIILQAISGWSMLKRIGWLGAILLLATVPGGFAETSEDGFKPAGVLEPTYSDVAYGPHPRNVLDFWQAESERPAPLVVYIHGGGFTGGDKSGFVGRDGRQVRRCLEKGEIGRASCRERVLVKV